MKKALSLPLQISLCTVGYLWATGSNIQAQVTTDGTVNTIVSPNENVAEITGGETRGSNLFHSFQEFSVGTGNEAFFNNANDISNIFSRVTGGNISNIDGLIRANGSASLFLINPAGIIFGENASLSIGGSFYGSSASSILFENGEFSAADLENPPLLTVNAPIGLGFRDNPGDVINRSNFGLTATVIDESINPAFAGAEFTILDSVGLEVNLNQTIALVGGNVVLENAGAITAPGGRVELGGISQAGEITINENGSLTFPQEIPRGDVNLSGQARVKVVADGGGAINVNARNLELSEGSELYAGIAEDMGSPDAQAGNININATESVRLLGQPRQAPLDIELLTIERDTGTGIRNSVGLSSVRRNNDNSQSSAIGNGGNINIDTKTLELINATVIDTSVFGEGDGGDIVINSSDKIILDQGVFLSHVRGFDLETVKEQGSGDAGNVLINTKSLLLTDQALILADIQTGATGNGGDVIIQASDTFTQNEDSFILTELGRGNIGSAGDIEITAGSYEIGERNVLPALQTDVQPEAQGDAGNITINVDNDFSIAGNLITAQTEGNGNAGNILINTKSLLLTDQALILADIQTGATGNGGDIIIQASDTFTQNEDSFILTQLGRGSIGSAGDIEITAGSYEIGERTTLPALQSDTQPDAQGDAGNITINVDNDFSIAGNLILAQIQRESTGNAGNISISAKDISIDDFALVSTNAASDSSGTAGSVSLNANNNISISNGSVVDALTENEFNGGEITVNAQNLDLLSGGKIVTGSENIGDAGDINLNIRENLIINNQNPSDDSPFDEPILQNIELQTGLFANTFPGATSNGGNISITAKSIDLQDNGSILAETTSGSGGNINLIVEDKINLRNNSLISAEASNQADGGNIKIDTNFIVAFPNQNNDIVANAQEGQGGNITITAKSILGIVERDSNPSNNTNDIDASSEFGLNGTVSIFTPDTNALEGAVDLPNNIVELQRTTTQACNAGVESGSQNNLTLKGRGGVRSSPGLPLESQNISINGEFSNSTLIIPEPIETSQGTIQPARGIKVTKDGGIVLTAYRTNNAGDRLPEGSINCGGV